MSLGVRPARGAIPSRSTIRRERLGALRNLPPFLAMVWASSWALTATTILGRLVRAVLPVATLFIGKLIIDEVVHLTHLKSQPVTFIGWLRSGLLNRLETMLSQSWGWRLRPTCPAGSSRWSTGCSPTASATTRASG